jgi:CRP/FNR family transcriptional regulator
MNVRVSLDCRFARFLLELGEKYSQLGYSRKTFRLSMSRSDLGNFLGATGESMSRVVARFNASAIVTIRGRNVDVHDWKALEDLSNGVHPSATRSLIH